MTKEELKKALFECKVAHAEHMDKEKELHNERQLAILEELLPEFPFITYDYTTNKYGYISFFIGKKEINLVQYPGEKPYFWLRLPYRGLFFNKCYERSDGILTKADFGKILNPMLEKEILGED